MCNCSDRSLKIYRLTFSGIGILVGLSVFIVFYINYNNLNAALWGLLSGVVSAVQFYVHLMYYKDHWRVKSWRLQYFLLSGCFSQLVGICGFVVYLTLAVVNHQGLQIENDGYYLTMVWCFMTWKWGFSLFYYSRLYKRQYCGSYEQIQSD